MDSRVLIQIENLKVHFRNRAKRNAPTVKAVDGVSLKIRQNETLGLVGESGCGKSTLSRAIVRLAPCTGGKILYRDKDLTRLGEAQMKPYYQNLQMVFQDPYASLNPRRSIRAIVGEPFRIHTKLTKQEMEQRICALLEDVGLSPSYIDRYPHEFSGGQRQRISIARAIALHPEFLICDEAVSALDVSVQAQVLNLFQELKERYALTYLFISHNLSVVKHVSDRIAVMYLGKVVELAEKNELFANPVHPYANLLMRSIPIPDPDKQIQLEAYSLGEIPSVMHLPSGCRFHTRCPYATALCRQHEPEQRDVGGGHLCSCHHFPQ